MKKILLFIGGIVSISLLIATLWNSQNNFLADFGYSTETLTFTGPGGSQWTHTIDANADNLESMKVTTTRINTNITPTTASNTNTFGFSAMENGDCTTNIYFTNGVDNNQVEYTTYLIYCKSGVNTVEIKHVVMVNEVFSDEVFHGAVTLQYNATPTPTSTATATALSCTGPDGSIIEHGQSKIYYSATTNANCANISESRTCNNGILEGNTSFQYSQCSEFESCTGPDGSNIAHGNSKIYYSAPSAVNCDTKKEERTCYKGTLSGSFTFGSCSSQISNEKDPYGLCEIWKDEEANNIKWSAIDYEYEKIITDDEGNQTTETVVDALKNGSFICEGIGGNHTEGYLSELPNIKTGILNLPTGFPLLNDLTCNISVLTEKGIESSCSLHQKLVSINTVQVNGSGKTWNFPLSVAGNKIIPIIYGGNTHEIYTEENGSNAVSKQTQIILVTDKKSNEVLEWSSPNGDTGSLKDYISGVSCTPSSPCTGEKVVFTSTTKLGTSSILLQNKSTKESATFTVHILPSAVEHIKLSNQFSSEKQYVGSRIELSAEMELFNGLSRNPSDNELEWEFSSDGGTTWVKNNEFGIVSGGTFLAKKEGLISFRAKITNVFAGINETNLTYKSEELLSENTLQIEIYKAPTGMVTINGEVASWHFPVSQRGSKNTSLIYGGNSTYSDSSLSGNLNTPTPTATADASTTASSSPSPTASLSDGLTSNCNLEGCVSEYQTKVSTETNIVLVVDAPDNHNLEWTASVSDTGILKDFVTQALCTQVSPCTSQKVIYYGGTKEGSNSILLQNKTTQESFSYTVYTLPSATESLTISNPYTEDIYTDSFLSFTATAELFNGNIRTPKESELVWEFSENGGTTWQQYNENGIVSGGKFFPKKEGIYTLRARILEKNGIVGKNNLRYKTHEVLSQNTITIQVKKAPEGSIIINGETGNFHFPVSQKGTKEVTKIYGGSSQSQATPTPTTISSNTSPTATPIPTPQVQDDDSNLYTYKVSTETSIVLVINKKNDEVINWSSPNTETGILTDYKTGQICSIQSPCTGSEVKFIGGEKEGVSSILFTNVTNNESITYSVQVFPSATESLTISHKDPLLDNQKFYAKSSIPLQAKSFLFNGISIEPNEETLQWKFSIDGGSTWETSSEYGGISGGILIPKKEGLFSVRAFIKEKQVLYGLYNLEYQNHEIVSENIITIQVEKQKPWHVLINGESKPWHFPVAISGPTTLTRSYGDTLINDNTDDSDNTDNTDNTDNSQSFTSEDSDEYKNVALENNIKLGVYIQDNENIEWFSSDSVSGYLKDAINNKKCIESSPCTNNSVIFVGGTEEGVSSITLKNTTLNESIIYTVHTLPAQTKNISLQSLNNSQHFMFQEIALEAQAILSNGEVETISAANNIFWEFSYDGGKTWEISSDNGIISGGIFTPKKEGSVLIRTQIKEDYSFFGPNELLWEKKDIFSSEQAILQIDKTLIDITEAHLLGNNIINRNTNTTVMASISSREEINNLQSLSVGLFTGTLNEETFDKMQNPAFIFKEYHNETPIKEYLAGAQGDLNRGIIELPIFIPEYDEKRYMKDGFYTIIIELYRDDRVISRYFLPVILGDDFASCDVNDDGFENVVDLILSLKFLNGSLHPNDGELKRVDKNTNGLIDLEDILILFPCILQNN